MPRWFMRKSGTRQNVDVGETVGIRSVVQCAVKCRVMVQECVGFNFNQGPPAMCELCRVPHDAPNTDMVVDSNWDHYAIVI